MPVKRLPSHPSLDHLKYDAKDLRKNHAAGDPRTAQLLREFHPRFSHGTDSEIFAAHFTLSDAQLAIAREAGFPSWARLKAHIQHPTPSGRLDKPHHERIEDEHFRTAVQLLDAGHAEGLRSHLRQYPELTRQRVVFEGGNYFRNPTLLEFIAENPVRHGRLPENIAAVTTVILDACAAESAIDQAALNETLMLVATGSVPRECRVQLPLIELLCARGADPASAVHAAALHGEQDALRALLGRGAAIDLPVASALGLTKDFTRLLPASSRQDRHLAFALASQFGQIEIVRLLLDAGEDPNRYHPPGGHSHSTPLHQAAAAGFTELVHLLVERGARTDLKDVLWQGTPADWAHHEGNIEIEAYLRAHAPETGLATKNLP